MISSITGIKVFEAMVPIVANNDTEGTGLTCDRQGYQDVLMIAEQGESGDTLSGSVYWTVTFQESDNGSSWTKIADADLQGGVNDHVIDAAAEDPTLVIRRYIGDKRYVRIFWDATGTHTNGTPIAGVILLAQPVTIPVTQATELGG